MKVEIQNYCINFLINPLYFIYFKSNYRFILQINNLKLRSVYVKKNKKKTNTNYFFLLLKYVIYLSEISVTFGLRKTRF